MVQPIDQASIIGGGMALIPDYLNQQIERDFAGLRNDQLRLENRAGQMELDEEARFQQAFAEYQKSPSVDGLLGLASVSRKRSREIIDQAKLQLGTDQQRALTRVASAFNLARSGKREQAALLVEQEIQADRNAGAEPDPLDVEILGMLRSDDPAEHSKAIRALGTATAFAGGADHASGIMKSLGLDPETRNLAAGDEIIQIDPLTGETRSVAKSEFIKSPEGELYRRSDVEGGDPASGGAGGQADPQTIWQNMIQAESGGRQVDSKGAPLRSSKGALGVAQVMPTTGPEAAALAGEPWDPQRLATDAGYNARLGQAYFQKQLQDFGDPVKAAAAYNAGPGAVRDAMRRGGDNWLGLLPRETRDYVAKVAGVPPQQTAQRGGPQPLIPKRRDAPSGFMWTGPNTLAPIPGGPADKQSGGARPMSADEKVAAGLDPSLVYYMGENGVPQLVGGQSGHTFKQIPEGLSKRVEAEVAQRDALSRSLSSFQDGYGGNVAGSLENLAQGIYSGVGTPGQRDWWADFAATDNQIRNELFGSALTAAEQRAYNATTVTPRMDPKEIRRNLNRRLQIVEGALQRRRKFMEANKFDLEAVDALLSPLPGNPGAGAGAPVRVRSVQEARKLPSGTVFIDPTGKRRVRP